MRPIDLPLPPVPARSVQHPPIPTWHFWLDQAPKPGYLNMAIDSALLALAERDGVGFLRVYRWAPACISFGRHEPALCRYDRARIDALGADAVRRPTGGRAVWHDAELTYAVAAPLGVLGSLQQSCGRIHAMLTDALRLLGVHAVAAPTPGRPASPDAGACFDTAAGGELLVGGRKVAGSAQLRTARALLQHGSLLLGGSQSQVRAITRAPHGEAAPTVPPLGRPVRFDDAAGAVAHAARRWEGDWHDVDRGEPIVELAAAYADGYRSEAWTWCR
jgi:lipoate-protein ligase A